MLPKLKGFVNYTLGKFGYQLKNLNNTLTLEASLHRLAKRPAAVQTVIDVGASDGRWSNVVRRVYPDAFYLLIEANAVHEAKLQSYQQLHPKVNYVLAAAGNKEGEILFDNSDPLGGIATDEPKAGYISVPMTTVDAQVQSKQLPPPYFLKLDTHGFEVPILEGAAQTLQNTSLLLIETYNFQLTPTSLRFHEMCSYLDARGFRPVDIIDPLHRNRDSVLWQFDVLFMQSSRPEFQDNHYN